MAWRCIAKTIGRLGRRLGRRREGIASVEFAIVLPLMVLMLFGAIEFGRLLVDYQVANKSVRDAVRYLSRVRDTSITGACPDPDEVYLWPASKAPQPVTELARNAVRLAMTGSIDKPTVPSDYLLGYWVDQDTIDIWVDCNDNTAGTFSGAYQYSDHIPELTMTATVTFPSGFGWLLSFLDDFSIQVKHNEVHIGD